MPSSIGTLFKLTTFGESHGSMVGGVLDGCPAGLKIDFKYIQNCLNKRRPGFSSLHSARKEPDNVEFVSGIFNGITTGTPIGFLIKNKDVKSVDYEDLKDVYRPSHADFTYDKKYGIRDYRGGGRSSARETVNWIVAGSIASQILIQKGIHVYSFVSSVGDIYVDSTNIDLKKIYSNDVRCPDNKVVQKIKKLIKKCKNEGDSIGGCVSTVIKGVPVGLGEPVFGKLQAALAQAMMSINAAKGVEFGLGFEYATKKGSEGNDLFTVKSNVIHTKTNHSGGLLGGISNGEDIWMRTAFKPPSTISRNQETINKKLKKITIKASGRHDPCVVPRAVSVIDSLVAIIILDYYLLDKTTKLLDI